MRFVALALLLALPPLAPGVGATVVPWAVFTVEQEGDLVRVDASGSRDAGPLAAYEWDWGDGSPPGSGVRASHRMPPGNWTITLTVTDEDGTRASHARHGFSPTDAIRLLASVPGRLVGVAAHGDEVRIFFQEEAWNLSVRVLDAQGGAPGEPLPLALPPPPGARPPARVAGFAPAGPDAYLLTEHGLGEPWRLWRYDAQRHEAEHLGGMGVMLRGWDAPPPLAWDGRNLWTGTDRRDGNGTLVEAGPGWGVDRVDAQAWDGRRLVAVGAWEGQRVAQPVADALTYDPETRAVARAGSRLPAGCCDHSAWAGDALHAAWRTALLRVAPGEDAQLLALSERRQEVHALAPWGPDRLVVVLAAAVNRNEVLAYEPARDVLVSSVVPRLDASAEDMRVVASGARSHALLPVSGRIEWGDGYHDPYTGAPLEHTYWEPGEYEVTLHLATQMGEATDAQTVRVQGPAHVPPTRMNGCLREPALDWRTGQQVFCWHAGQPEPRTLEWPGGGAPSTPPATSPQTAPPAATTPEGSAPTPGRETPGLPLVLGFLALLLAVRMRRRPGS